MLSKLFRTAHCKVEQFRGKRLRQSDEEFLAECEIAPASDVARVAIAVRRCVADVGLIDPLFIRPKDEFPGSLDVLPLWDSMDFIDLTLRIERELSAGWKDSKDATVFAVPFTVRELIRRVAIAVDSVDETPLTHP